MPNQSHTPTPQSPLTVFISRNGEQLKAGVVCFRKSPQGGGWQFVPTTCAHQPSRKLWDRPADAIPKWVGPYTLTDPNVGEGLALWQRLNKLTYRYGFDSPEARDIGTASTMVKSHGALVAALRVLCVRIENCAWPTQISELTEPLRHARAALAAASGDK